MIQNENAAMYLESASGIACLTLNETDAVVRTPAAVSHKLYAYFRHNGVSCALVHGSAGRDVIDLGNPSPDEERRIRSLFVAWRADDEGGRELPAWYAWVTLAVVALWLLTLFTQ